MIRRHALALAVPAALFLVMLLPLAGGFTDDGYIHIQYARNIIERGEYSFNPGEPSFGTTSPLWVMELAAIGSFFSDRATLVLISQILSWLAGFGALVAAYALALSLGANRFLAVVAATILAADVWLVRWTALGMESSSAALAVLVMVLASVRAHESPRWAAGFGAAAAVASLLRPEVYLALPVFVVAALTLGRRMPRRHVIIAFAVAAVLLLPWLVYARVAVGSFLPNTAGAKSGGVILSPVTFVRKLDPVVKIVASAQAVSLVALLVSLVTMRSRSLLFSPRARFAVLWVVALPVAYVLFDMQILSRYLLLVTPVVCVLAWAALAEASAVRSWRRERAVAVAAAAVAVLVSVVFYTRVVVVPSRAFSHDLQHNLRGLGEYLHQTTAPDAVVAAADIGYLAFYSGRRVLDLGGLVEPVTGELRAEYSYEEIVDRGLYFGLDGYPHVDYFIDRDHQPDRFSGRTVAGHRFEKVFETTVRNLGIRKPGTFHYTLYHLTPVNP
jgi:hypothetical protein